MPYSNRTEFPLMRSGTSGNELGHSKLQVVLSATASAAITGVVKVSYFTLNQQTALEDVIFESSDGATEYFRLKNETLAKTVFFSRGFQVENGLRIRTPGATSITTAEFWWLEIL